MSDKPTTIISGIVHISTIENTYNEVLEASHSSVKSAAQTSSFGSVEVKSAAKNQNSRVHEKKITELISL